jgi:hypothetical protein
MSYQTNKRWRKQHPSAWQITKRRYYKQFEANAVNKSQRWSFVDIWFVMQKKVSDRHLAQQLGRSVKAIQCLRVRMKGKQL